MQVAAAVLLVPVLATLSAAWLPAVPATAGAPPPGLVEGPWQSDGCAPGVSLTPGDAASPGLTVLRVLAVVLGLAAALKLPLLLAKALLAKVLLLLPLAWPLALPLIAPFLLLAALLPMTGMDDTPEAAVVPPGPVTPVVPPQPGQGPNSGNAVPSRPAVPPDQSEARAAWIENCVQRVACQLSRQRVNRDCTRYRCAAIDWISST